MATRLDIRDNGGMVFYTYTLPDRGQALAVFHSTLLGYGYENDDCLVMTEELDKEGLYTAIDRRGQAATFHLTEDVLPPYSLTYATS